ncbi:adhesion G-protein coupled receptor G4-like [Polyodon spathula]|uniref:adhesion G-protein coupled receptor G4-like n=1 Tax=Polyodon spathula TaxID=7913 RepID=UPI001B7E6CA7|nr:adhesion G-protein coupled receptor G4-like [Polyodon spathula]
MELIKQLLIQNSSYTDEVISLKADPASIHIQLIDPGSCPPEVTHSFFKGNYTWPEITAGDTACLHCSGNPNHFAMRKCGVAMETDRANWENPMLQSCPMVFSLPDNILDLGNVEVTADNAMVLAELIKNLTSNSPKINPQEVEIVVSKVAEILQVGEVTPLLGLTIINIITNIMEKESNLQSVANQILEITESIGNKMSFDGESVSLTSPMLALTVLNINSFQFDGLAFGVTSFIPGHNPQTFLNQDPFDDTVAYISLPRSLEKHLFQQSNRTMARIQFHFYGKPVLFQDSILRDRILNTYVVSASATNVTIRDLTDPVTITLQHIKPNQDLSRTPISALDDRIMTMITYVGCGLSSIFLIVTLLSYIAFDKLRQDYPSKILMNLSAALLLLNLLFLLNTWLASFGNHGMCICLAVTLHYSLLASFTWMLLAAVHMYFALVKVFNIYVRAYILKLCSIGWGVPLVVVSIVLVINKDFYGSGVSAESVSPSKTPEDVL